MMEELAFDFQATNFPILTIIQISSGTNPISFIAYQEVNHPGYDADHSPP